MTTAEDRINHLNSALMVASCAAAYAIPFELFLLAYAVLGPLHYLTEISWIHDRRYFLDRDRSAAGRRLMSAWLILVGTTLAVMLYGLVAEKVLEQAVSPVWEIGLFYLVFVSAAVFVFTRSLVAAAGAALLTGLGAIAFSSSPYYGLIAFLIITIVHVLIFTAAFILFGALKSRSRSGALSLAVFALCVTSIFLIAPGEAAPAGDFVRKTYAPFEVLNTQLIQILGLGPGSALRDIYQSNAGGIVMRLIAFAYTYHYLNWFTKTSVIGWNRISRVRAGVILALWLASLALYATDYLLGFIALYSLSVLHVMLELPLNHQSFAGVGKELYGLLRRASPAPASGPVRVSRKAARKAQRARLLANAQRRRAKT
jgi:hypothetical protein